MLRNGAVALARAAGSRAFAAEAAVATKFDIAEVANLMTSEDAKREVASLKKTVDDIRESLAQAAKARRWLPPRLCVLHLHLQSPHDGAPTVLLPRAGEPAPPPPAPRAGGACVGVAGAPSFVPISVLPPAATPTPRPPPRTRLTFAWPRRRTACSRLIRSTSRATSS